ncbi:hypothetical protein [Trueperella pecoris]|uniref:hypothetical protein n=1 Tax=Trueperella pecoris TaxID=2733571 RepID=UPI00186B73DA|nr:hypothetical protein [Trueperella pecoris]QOQ39702.1 hypothetical protein HLG82_09800 [Trueperella pecoris]
MKKKSLLVAVGIVILAGGYGAALGYNNAYQPGQEEAIANYEEAWAKYESMEKVGNYDDVLTHCEDVGATCLGLKEAIDKIRSFPVMQDVPVGHLTATEINVRAEAINSGRVEYEAAMEDLGKQLKIAVKEIFDIEQTWRQEVLLPVLKEAKETIDKAPDSVDTKELKKALKAMRAEAKYASPADKKGLFAQLDDELSRVKNQMGEERTPARRVVSNNPSTTPNRARVPRQNPQNPLRPAPAMTPSAPASTPAPGPAQPAPLPLPSTPPAGDGSGTPVEPAPTVPGENQPEGPGGAPAQPGGDGAPEAHGQPEARVQPDVNPLLGEVGGE